MGMKGLRNLVVAVIAVMVFAIMLTGCGSENNNSYNNEATMEDYRNSIDYFSYTRNSKGILLLSFSGNDVLDTQDTIPEFGIAFVEISYLDGLYGTTSYYINGNSGIINQPIALPTGTIEVSIVATATDGKEYYLQNVEVNILENKKSFILPISFLSEKTPFGSLTVTTSTVDSDTSTFSKGTYNNHLVDINLLTGSTENIYAKNIYLTLRKGSGANITLSSGDIIGVNVYEGIKWFGGLGVLGLYQSIDLNFTCLKSTTRTLSIEVDIPYDSLLEYITVTDVKIEVVGLESGKTDIISYSLEKIIHSIE